ncbi:MAG TPA: OB-fold nucleic acid binding domain-containing protein [Thermodesulfovibrionales bacterium]|nr:OB-fold nucleic acid binding domain-containing protein [Thermodesulfovibrionales bacterium]
MKRILALIVGIMIAFIAQTTACIASSQSGAEPASAGVSGKVVDTMDSGGYTYVQLDQGGKKTWVAAPKMNVKKGQVLTFRPGMVMENFESKTLKRTFDRIIFSDGLADQPSGAAGSAGAAGSKAQTVPAEKVSVAKATGTNAYTVAELYKNKKSLNGKSVTVRAKVMKVTAGIMKLNWIHLQDGTGDANKGTQDIVATSAAELPTIGDVVTVKGTLAADKDFGSGYKYAVLIEKATFKK